MLNVRTAWFIDNEGDAPRFITTPPFAEEKMIQELEDVILNCGLPEHRLRRGDIGTVVLVRPAGKGYEVEFATLDGETVAIVTLMVNQVRPSKPREIAHVRDLTANP